MSFQAQAWAQRQRVGDPNARAILMALANYADEEGSCFPGQERLAEDCEISLRTVIRKIEYLEERGFITRKRRYRQGGKRTSDRFFLSLHANLSHDKLSDLTCQIGTVTLSDNLSDSVCADAREAVDELLEVVDRPHADALIEHREQLGDPLTPYKAKLLAKRLSQCPDPHAAADEMVANGWKTIKPRWMPKPLKAGDDGAGGKAKPIATRFVHAAKAGRTWRWCCAKMGHDPQRVDDRGGWEFPADLLDQFLNLPAAEHANGRW